jgi:cytochrome P450
MEEKIRRFREQHGGPRLRDTMLFKDGTDHERLRNLVSKAFTPRMIEGLRGRVQELTDELLDTVEPAGHMDVIADLAYPLPVTVICELLRIPAADRAKFRVWTAKLARSLDPSTSPAEEEEILRAGDEAAAAFGEYFADVIARRRRDPGEDLLSALIGAEERGDTLSTHELMATCVLLLVAGHETTTNLIGNGMFALLCNPTELEKLRRDPSPDLMRTAVEELLRYEPPVVATLRIALEDIPFAGSVIPAGHDVFVVIAAANRDPARFPYPDRLDVTRIDNRHLSFSGGPHFCLGAPLARLEGQIAISTLLRRFSGLRLESEEPQWRDTITLRSLKALPVSLS